jgi:murein DD-endopeptidase MepM/ murein hydrolase activator NlpD
MRELSGEQRTEREWDPDASAGDESQARTAWLRYVFAALGIAALGLVVAASVGLTTEAQTAEGDLSALPETSSGIVVAPEKKEPTSNTGALAAFASRETSATNRPTRSSDLQAAIVKEQAAQRDELLAKTADEVSRAAEAASGDARQKELTVVGRASREAGARIAAENLRRAIAARVAAANRRQAAESTPDGQEVAADKGTGDSGSAGNNDSGGRGGTGGGGGGNSSGGVAPVPGAVIGAHFGEYGSWSRYHTGIDFRAAHGTPIRAVKSGVVLYAGNIKPHKNLERLIRAYAQVRASPGHEDLKLIIIGDEAVRYPALRRCVEAAGVRQDVRFFGFVPDRTLSALYRMATVFAFPSLYEGFGLPPLEAMACGTPVVTSRISSLPEVFGDAAVLVDPHSEDDIAAGIARVLDEPALRAELVERGHARVKLFSWERSVEAIHAGYMKVLGQTVTAVATEPAR